MEDGDEVEIGDAHGDFVFPDKSDKTYVFIVGGIGITPVRSMILGAIDKGMKNQIVLLWTNKTPLTTPLFNEFNDLENENIEVIMNMTQDTMGNPELIEGRITGEQIKKLDGDNLYYVVGSPEFEKGMMGVLKEVGVSGEDVITEGFGGY